MTLYELIIKASVHVHAAELAVQAKSPDSAYDELGKLYDLLENEVGTGPRSNSESSDDAQT
ncbi:hypothetical protein ES703_83959 [subsurface metagenome]